MFLENLRIKKRDRRPLTDRRFGRLVVLRRDRGSETNPNTRWLCLCDCGSETIVQSDNLKSGRITSCGCLHKELLVKRNTTHGLRGSGTYRAWAGIISRTTNNKEKSWKHYGGRGIAVCDSWRKFENFLADMGERPTSKHSIDRFPDNNGNYEPGNCRWATIVEQANNRRTNIILDVRGEEMSIANAARYLGIKYCDLRYRVLKGSESIFGVTKIRGSEMSVER